MSEVISKDQMLDLSRDLDAYLKSLSWYDSHGQELLKFFGRVLLFCVGLFIFSSSGWIAKIFGMSVISYAYYGISITGVHETSHGSFVRSKKINKILAYLFTDFWAGESSRRWYYRHVRTHHNFTNIPGKDGQTFYYPWINKYLYFFVLPILFVQSWFLFNSVKFLRHIKPYLFAYLFLFFFGWVFQVWVFSFFTSLEKAALCTFIMRSFWAPVFVHLAVFNHVGLDFPENRLPWLPHQTKTTRNLKRNWFLDGFGGNAFMECHLEHHIFPWVSNGILAKIKHRVRHKLKKMDYVYLEEGYFVCLKKCLSNYDKLFSPGLIPFEEHS